VVPSTVLAPRAHLRDDVRSSDLHVVGDLDTGWSILLPARCRGARGGAVDRDRGDDLDVVADLERSDLRRGGRGEIEVKDGTKRSVR